MPPKTTSHTSLPSQNGPIEASNCSRSPSVVRVANSAPTPKSNPSRNRKVPKTANTSPNQSSSSGRPKSGPLARAGVATIDTSVIAWNDLLGDVRLTLRRGWAGRRLRPDKSDHDVPVEDEQRRIHPDEADECSERFRAAQ